MTTATPATRHSVDAPVRPARSIAPAWSAVAAWGAGLIELALGAGALRGDDADRGAGVILLALGACALVWGAAVLVRGRLVLPRTGAAGALAAVVATVGAFALDPVRTSVAAAALAVVLLIAVALACVRQARAQKPAAPARLTVLLAAAIVVAGTVTPALGATEAGQLAPDHSSHGVVDPGHH